MVGRMQPIHKGHQQLIDLGLELCEKFVILLGSSNESRTKSNPLTFTERYELIKKIYGNKVEVYPIMDIGIGFVPEWGNYIMNTINFYCDSYPDFYIGGVEEGRKEVFNNYPNISTLSKLANSLLYSFILSLYFINLFYQSIRLKFNL